MIKILNSFEHLKYKERSSETTLRCWNLDKFGFNCRNRDSSGILPAKGSGDIADGPAPAEAGDCPLNEDGLVCQLF